MHYFTPIFTKPTASKSWPLAGIVVLFSLGFVPSGQAQTLFLCTEETPQIKVETDEKKVTLLLGSDRHILKTNPAKGDGTIHQASIASHQWQVIQSTQQLRVQFDDQPPIDCAAMIAQVDKKVVETEISPTDGQTPTFIAGYSLGGRVRSGPGTRFDHIASLRKGDKVKIVAPAKVNRTGFDWFEIRYGDDKIGYQWGGLLCSTDKDISGIKNPCPRSLR